MAGVHGAWAILVALATRRRQGRGLMTECVMLEAALNVCAQPIVEYAAYGRVMKREGNRALHAAPQGVYACAGIDEWLALSVLDGRQWDTLARIVGGEELASQHHYATIAGRHARHDELDRIIGEWAVARSADEAAKLLRSNGVPAAACWDPRTIDEHPQYIARRLFETVDHPVLGRHRAPGPPYRFENVDRWVTRPAPTFGQHTREVLRDVLGFDEAGVDRFFAQGVVADRPRGL